MSDPSSLENPFFIRPILSIAPLFEPNNIQFFQRGEDDERETFSQSA